MTLLQLIGGIVLLVLIVGSIIFFVNRAREDDVVPEPTPTVEPTPEPTPTPTPTILPTPTPIMDEMPETGITSESFTFTIEADGLVPKAVTIEKGGGVVIENHDSETHLILYHLSSQSNMSNPQSVYIEAGEEVGIQFERPGLYLFYDEQNPVSRGALTVK